MIDTIYEVLAAVGFSHPLHPALTHIPMGMVIGAFTFGLLALKWKDHHFSLTAFYCATFGLIMIVPLIITGLMDWQHRYEGEWLTLIIVKMILSVILTGLLTTSVISYRKGASAQRVFLWYALCMATAGGLGFSGGELVY